MTLTGLRAGDARFDLPGSGSIAADGRTDAVTIDLGGSRRVATTGGPRCTIRKSGTAAVRCG